MRDSVKERPHEAAGSSADGRELQVGKDRKPNRSDAAAVLRIDDPRWARFVAERPESTPFHHPAWANLLTRTYGYRSFAAGVFDRHGRVTAGAPFLDVRRLGRRTQWISLPFTDQCAV